MTNETARLISEGKLRHIAFIMDGNGRWASGRGLQRNYGHKEGAEVFERIATYCGDIGIKYVTFYAFSTENWKRPKNEINALMRLFNRYITDSFERLAKQKTRVVFIGSKDVFAPKMRERMEAIERESECYDRILNIAINYGSRAEIVNAVNSAIADGKTVLTEEDIESRLYTRLSPDPDLIVRTAGEERLSNFLLWQAAYSEFYFTDTLWPDMKPSDVDKAIEAYFGRKRNFGAV